FFKAGATQVITPLGNLPVLEREVEIEQLRSLPIVPEDLELSAFHPLGTCRIGADARRGVINPELESYEAERLFVVDGSIFPSSLGVNPQLTIMAFAARGAEHIEERLRGKARR